MSAPEDDYVAVPPPAEFRALFDKPAAPERAQSDDGGFLALLSDRRPLPRASIPHEHLEADARYHPKHWCAWCGQNRGREPMKVVRHHRTEAAALKCVDESACSRREQQRKRQAA